MEVHKTNQTSIKQKVDLSVLKQIVKDRAHPLDMVREAISNMGDPHVGAKICKISYFHDPKYGSSFRFEDDGCGMVFTGDESNPGGLDRFINFGYSKQAGLKAGKFSEKGLP